VDVHPFVDRNLTCMDEIMMDERDIGLERIPPPPRTTHLPSFLLLPFPYK
jgi:hypothetical protein